MLESRAALAGLALEADAADMRMRRLSVAADRSRAGIAWVDDRGSFAATNDTCERLLGYGAGGLIGLPWRVALHPDDHGAATAGFERMLENGDSRFEARAVRKDGSEFEVAVELVRADLADGFGGHSCTFYDVSARQETRRTRERLDHQLRQSQKMQAYGQLAGGIAHDFNNLLTVVLGHTEGLLAAADDPRETLDAHRGALEQIRRAGERVVAMTRQLLAFSRHQVRRVELVPLERLVARSEDLLRRVLPDAVALELRLDEESGEVRADAAQLEQVLVNLVLNARDAMPEGGTLTVETTGVDLDADAAGALGLAGGGHFARLVVSDTGSGMPPEVLDRAFEPFFTTKPIGRGTGLGLATVYGIVSGAGGAVHIDTRVGHGTSVSVHLPRTAGALAPSESGAGRPDGGAETILVCDDEPMVLALTRRILERAGYRVLAVGDGDEALAAAAAHDGRIGLLLTDVVMPRMNGVELARRLTSERPDLTVLYVSGFPDDEMLTAEGISDEIEYLEKPFSPDSLLRRVRAILDDRN